jgi:predicted transcriptional regulator
MTKSQSFTVGDLSKLTGRPQHQIAYALQSRGIEPAHRVGILRVFDAAQLPTILDALKQTRAHHAHTTPATV